MTIIQVRSIIAKMRTDGKSYQYIGNKYGVNRGVIHKIHNSDYIPTDKELRRKLGIEDLTVDFIRQLRNPKGTFTIND